LGMGPGEGKEALVLHFLHDRLPSDVLIAGIINPARGHLTRYKWAIQLHAKPLAKLAVVSQRTPDPRNRRLELNALFNSVIHIRQPPSCILSLRGTKSNPSVALSSSPGLTNKPFQFLFPDHVHAQLSSLVEF